MLIHKLLFPCRCPFCDEAINSDEPCCDDCKKYLEIVPSVRTLPNGHKCLSAFLYEGIYRKAVLKYKYHKRKQLHYQFAIILSTIIKEKYYDIDFDCYTSVPPHIHKRKNTDKKFDQTSLLAKETAKLDKIQYQRLLFQSKEYRTQHTLSKEERIVNVKGVFECLNDADINNKTILLFDDIVTTGNTLSSCVDMLMKNGAKQVYCVTIAW